jgi:hypothetical protein
MHEDEIARLQRCIQAKVEEIIALGVEVHRLRSERDEDAARAMGYSSVKEVVDTHIDTAAARRNRGGRQTAAKRKRGP